MLDSQVFCPAELDYSVLARHAGQLSTMAEVANSGISVFDMYRRNHPFVSRNFGRLFKYDLSRIDAEDAEYFNLQIHPDDFPAVMRNGVIGLRFVLENLSVVFDTKLVCEYRINVSGRWVRGIEQMQVLETDPRGNIWLALSVLDMSPNQTPLERVEAKLYNFKTGELFPLPDYPEYEGEAVALTSREKQVLKLVRDGFLSKEISEQLRISVHTVNTYRQRIIEKLNVNNSLEAIRLAMRLGLLD
ncbi:LuxR C-terminal-related transcriptional regulator [Alistipes muris]|uniref:response regulator transcription factor n=1 Tax=Alistipes muris TaxID=2941326 RepID=UPI00203FA47F|nr:LuxR C-terminal-related transcriptional regulator [Alistipes muris]